MDSIKKDILKIIRAFLIKNYDFELSCDLKDIRILAEKYGFGPIAGYVLNKNRKYKNNHMFDDIVYKAASTYEKQLAVRDYISKGFEENKIDFLIVKGTTLAKYYDEPYLRNSNDIDVIVEKENISKAEEVLVKKLHFKKLPFTDTEMPFAYKGVHIDLQYKLIDNDDYFNNIYNSIEINNTHELEIEYKYLLVLSHAAKHLKYNYINLQFLIDFFYINKLKLDKNFINDKLLETGLKKFNDINIETLDSIVNDKKPNELTSKYLDYLLNVINNDGVENMLLAGKQIDKSNTSYIVTRLFPSYNKMVNMYPKLKKNKILLPHYYVVRIIDRMKIGKDKQAINELRMNTRIDKNRIEEIAQLFKNIGL